MSSNNKRVFGSVVSVDAWHTAYSEVGRTASIHVDVSFLKGKLGDEPQSPVRFEIALKRAEVVFVIPSSEPLSVLQSSVKREVPISVQTTILRTNEIKRDIAGKASFSLMAANLDAEAQASGSINDNSTRTQKVEREDGVITWAQSKTDSGSYKWELAPSESKTLFGKAWNAVTEPLLKVKLAESGGSIGAVSRIEIRCRREDLVISNISLKSSGLFRNAIDSIGPKKMAAVEAYIRLALSSKNLDTKNFSDPYGEIEIANIFVEAQVE